MVIVFFLDLNMIFNLSNPSHHSQISKNFTLNPLTFTFNPLKVNNKALHSNPLGFMLTLSLPSTLREKDAEGRGKFLYFSIIFVMQWFEGDIKIIIMSPIYFLA